MADTAFRGDTPPVVTRAKQGMKLQLSSESIRHSEAWFKAFAFAYSSRKS